jgi:hypothetical protein
LAKKKIGKEAKEQMNGCTVNAVCGNEVDWMRMHAYNETVSGVFAPLINNAAFVDKLVLGIKGKLRRRLPKTIRKTANLAIGGPGRPYARSLHGIYLPAGIPFEVKYGRNRNRTYRNLFEAKLTVRSERKPLSFSEVTKLVSCLFRKGNRSILNGMEFTSDVSVPPRYFETHILTRARSIRTLVDDLGRQTLYAGAPGARWMLRIYQKTKETTRVEYVLRRSFLAKAGVNDLAHLGALRDVPLTRLVRFPAVCQRALEDLVTGKVTGEQLQLILGWPERRPIGMLLDILRDYGLPGDQILRVSAVEEMLWKMQKSFAWSNGS